MRWVRPSAGSARVWRRIVTHPVETGRRIVTHPSFARVFSVSPAVVGPVDLDFTPAGSPGWRVEKPNVEVAVSPVLESVA